MIKLSYNDICNLEDGLKFLSDECWNNYLYSDDISFYRLSFDISNFSTNLCNYVISFLKGSHSIVNDDVKRFELPQEIIYNIFSAFNSGLDLSLISENEYLFYTDIITCKSL